SVICQLVGAEKGANCKLSVVVGQTPRSARVPQDPLVESRSRLRDKSREAGLGTPETVKMAPLPTMLEPGIELMFVLSIVTEPVVLNVGLLGEGVGPRARANPLLGAPWLAMNGVGLTDVVGEPKFAVTFFG